MSPLRFLRRHDEIEGPEGRVLVAAMARHDAETLANTLEKAGIQNLLCRDVEHFCAELVEGAGAALIAEECISRQELRLLKSTLATAPAWSEMPIVVMVRRGRGVHPSLRVLQALEGVARVTLLERPVSSLTLASTVRAALASRRHQYFVRETIEKLMATEAALIQNEARLRAAVEASGIGVFDYDASEGTLDASEQSWWIVTGAEDIPPSGNLDRWRDAVHPEDRPRFEDAWRDSLDPASHGHFELDFRVVREDGSTRWVTASGQTRLDHGRAPNLVGTVQDMTEEIAKKERLRQLTEELEGLVAARTEKLEQRTGQLRRLANQLVFTEQRERSRLATMLHDHLQQLLAAAKIQVDLARDASRQLELDGELASVQKLLEESVDASRSLAMELSPPALQSGPISNALRWQAEWMASHHRFHTDLTIEEDLPRLSYEIKVLLFDATRELLFNAVKHASVDRASVRLSRAENDLCLSIEDEGRGFSPEDELTKSSSEDGFGLFSIRERLEAVGGRMNVESAPGKGATFRLYVPASGGAKSTTVPMERGPGSTGRRLPKKIRLLVVDDHPIVRDGIVSMLRRSGDMEVVGEASDGEEAIDLAGLLKPDLVVMDINMPKMDGLHATREIKRRYPEINVIGLSIQGEETAAREMQRAGASAFLPKGGRSEVFFETLRKVVMSNGGPAGRPT